MLLLHTTGTTKIGDVRRYTITYTPSLDRILPLPDTLHLRIKNTASLPLRAAYLHGPYTLYVSVCRSEFRAGSKVEVEDEDGGKYVPVYDPHVKAGASFYATLRVPRELVEDGVRAFQDSTVDAPVEGGKRGYEHGASRSLDGRRSFPGRRAGGSVTWVVEVVSQVIFTTTATVGYEILVGRDEKSLSFGFPFGGGNSSPAGSPGSPEARLADGVLSRAVSMTLQTTEDLWGLPSLPSWGGASAREMLVRDPEQEESEKKRRPKKVHLVVLTHGLHSNTGADMLFLKEEIDKEESKAALLRKKQREKEVKEGKKSVEEVEKEEEEDEQVIVRGYHDNACKTERGIKYLGKRLARFVSDLCNPQHGPLPQGNNNKLKKPRKHHHPHLTSAARDLLEQQLHGEKVPPYKITSISFIGHSLGGLVQTYAIAYIHVHSPTFFHEIKPANFVALATPFLGLSNENPLYVKFALDFGLVGKTGHDLGLTWRTPGAFSAFSGGNGSKKTPAGDASKPLLRILPTGPAHEVLQMFTNRTVYANVVNDGIVPLRTSCLLFLDWKGLGRVEKARRENGPVGGLVEWGWGQLVTTSGSSGNVKPSSTSPGFTITSPFTGSFWGKNGNGDNPSPTSSSTDIEATQRTMPEEINPIGEAPLSGEPTSGGKPNPFVSLMTLLRPHAGTTKPPKRAGKIYHRSQTHSPAASLSPMSSSPPGSPGPHQLEAPPRTSIFEAAGDVLNPPLPSTEFIIHPESRPRTIFHDRVYHPEDVPPPPAGREMKVEEKIARAYHRGLSWRKVLVRLEPDAHNNMVVRRMFANAYGWEVVRHVVETHFGGSETAVTPDHLENSVERARDDVKEERGDGVGAVADVDARGRGHIPRRSDTVDTRTSASWSSAAFDVSDDSDSESAPDAQQAEETLNSFLGLAPGLRPPPRAEVRGQAGNRERGLVEVSRVSAEMVRPSEHVPGVMTGLGLRVLNFGERVEQDGESEAVKLLERCSNGSGRGERDVGKSVEAGEV